MYGLTSRDSLAKRQLKWVREVDASVRDQPAQRAMTRQPTPVRETSSIISLMTDELAPSQTSNQMSQTSNQMSQTSNQALASTQHSMLRKSETTAPTVAISAATEESLSQMINELRQECATLRRMMHDSSKLSKRMDELEASMGELSSRSVAPIRRPVSPLSNHINSSDFSLLPPTEIVVGTSTLPLELLTQARNGRREFLPFYIKEDYAGRDNLTILDGVNFEMVVEIVGPSTKTPIIYPFGEVTDLPEFAPLTLEMEFHNNTLQGTAYGSFKRGANGIYTIEIVELHSNGVASGLETYTLPLTLRCHMDLYTE